MNAINMIPNVTLCGTPQRECHRMEVPRALDLKDNLEMKSLSLSQRKRECRELAMRGNMLASMFASTFKAYCQSYDSLTTPNEFYEYIIIYSGCCCSCHDSAMRPELSLTLYRRLP